MQYYAFRNDNNMPCRCCQQVFEFMTDKHKVVVITEKALKALGLKEGVFDHNFQSTPVKYSRIFLSATMVEMRCQLTN